MIAANLYDRVDGQWVESNKFAENGISYDKNGNILSMKRTDVNGNLMHDIDYVYQGNQLYSLTLNGEQINRPYQYDANGNMVYDGHTGAAIKYNILNLPETISVDNNEKISYVYSASGEKLAMDVEGSLTYYRSVMVYSKPVGGSEQLAHIIHPEGIVQYNSTKSDFTYKYFKTDYLGSTRAVLAAIWDSGTNSYLMELEQSTDYYPFGLAHELNDLGVNKYLFSGKEIQDGIIGSDILGLYDFGSRYYNPFLGRWFNIDPALEFANPYLYCLNSPMMYLDPNGESLLGALLIGALIGATTYTVGVAVSPGGFDNWNWGHFFGAVGIGALSGATSHQVGLIFDGMSPSFGTEVLRGVAHGATSSVFSGMQGGDLAAGFASGMFSSFAVSGFQALAGGIQDAGVYTAGTLAVGAISGGVGASMNGGNFWEGAGQGLIVAALNHLGASQQSKKEGSFEDQMRQSFPHIGEQVMEPLEGFWEHLLYFEGREWVDYTDYGTKVVYPVNSKGVAECPMLTGYAPTPGKLGKTVFIKGLGAFNKVKFHLVVKKNILNAAGNYSKFVGKNPDIFIQKGNVMLKGTHSSFKGKVFDTGLKAKDFFY